MTKQQESSFSCEVQTASAASTLNVPQMGGYGLRRRLINGTTTPALSSIPGMSSTSDHLMTAFETPTNTGDTIGQEILGYFVAPVTSTYRFYTACNQKCELLMALDPTN